MSWLILLGSAWAGPVEEHRLDGHPWQECSQPSDDTWIVRMGGGYTDVYWFDQDPDPGSLTASIPVIGESFLSPVQVTDPYAWISAIPAPYEVNVYWHFGSKAASASQVLQDEFTYSWGDDWPAEIETAGRFLYQSLTYDPVKDSKASSWYEGMSTFCRWDETTYDPEECFVGWTLCISHLRPDRMVMAWTIDASSASRYQEHLPNPVMMVFDEHDQYVAYLDFYNVDENFAIEGEWYDITINTVFGDKLLDQTYSGTTEDEVWSHLLTDTGAE